MIRRILAAALPATCLFASQAAAQVTPAPFTSYTRYDALGRPVGTIGVDPDDAGPLGRAATRTSYNAQGRVAAVETGVLSAWPGDTAPAAWSGFTPGARTDYSYDDDGRKTREIVTGGTAKTVTHFSYDNMNRVHCVAQRMNLAVAETLTVDACTPGLAGSQGPDRITRTSYTGLGKPAKIEKAVGLPSLEQDYAIYTYDWAGRLLSVTDANKTRAEYQYDSQGRLFRWYFPSKVTAYVASTTDYEEYGYDANGNRISLRKRDGVTISYQYDALNRQTFKTVPPSAGQLAIDPSGATGGYTVAYGYDLRGLQLYARFGSFTGPGVTNAYDNAGRLTSSTTSMDGSNRTVSWLFDANGNRSRVQHPDGAFFTSSYDNTDRIKTATWTNGTTPFFVAHYDQFGRREGHNTGGVYTGLGYDGLNRLTIANMTFSNGGNHLSTELAYNPASQIITETRNNSSYVWTGGVNIGRTYTVNGLNQYLSVGSAPYGYDDNGNLTFDGTSAYVYDAENRLVSSSASGGTTLSYDPLGRLWKIWSQQTGTTSFVYEGDHVSAEYDWSGNMLRRYFWGPGADEPIIQDEGGALNCGGTRFLHANHQGSIIAASNCNGNLTAVNRYDEYGIPQGNWGRFQYTGQAWLPELGMYYYKARLYSATLGRFLQTDPIGYDDQVNLYAYVGNDPVNRTDPLGTYTCSASKENCKAVAAALDRAKNALKSDNLSKSDRGKISRVLKAYGEEGRKNGVVVADAGKEWLSKNCPSGAACAFSAGTSRGSWTASNHTVVLPRSFSNKAYPSILPRGIWGGRDYGQFSRDDEKANMIIHEGKHIQDFQNGGVTGEVSEFSAYQTGLLINKAFGSQAMCTIQGSPLC